jgi:hypothetical protein
MRIVPAHGPALLHQAASADNETTMERGERHNRRSIHLNGYDYTMGGAYFMTICTRDRERTFQRRAMR